MITITPEELDALLSRCSIRTYQARDMLSQQGQVSDAVFFINRGITRSLIVDRQGEEHSIHFSMENSFIAEYSSFMTQQPGANSIQALEETEVVVMPREAVLWGYDHLREGDRMGRLIAEGYFLYFDNRLKNQYIYTAAERYKYITKIFPNIHHRVPQHMIASYLGITPVHLSRLKRQR